METLKPTSLQQACNGISLLDLTWSHIAQYDSISETIGFNSRLRWEYRPGAIAYLVLNQSYLNEDGEFQSENSDVTLKVGASIRF